jgi:hypothetical protein
MRNDVLELVVSQAPRLAKVGRDDQPIEPRAAKTIIE